MQRKMVLKVSDRALKISRHFLLICVSAIGLMTIIATGGGGGGDTNTPNKTAPSISNFSYSPTSVIIGDGGGTVTVTVDFEDDDGDVSNVIIDILDANNNQVDQIDTSLQDVSGDTSGTINIDIVVDSSTEGNYTFELYVIDETDRESNTLTGTFDVTTYPNTVIQTIYVGDGPSGIAVTPDGNYVYVTNVGDDTVSGT